VNIRFVSFKKLALEMHRFFDIKIIFVTINHNSLGLQFILRLRLA
jgi:hypothetical protein